MPNDAVRELALSSLLLGFTGPRPPAWLLDALSAGLGGVVLFGSNVGDGHGVASLTAQLRAAAGRDVVVALDEEGGDVTRLDSARGSTSPGAAALGYLDDVAATEQAYARIGSRLAEAGVTVDLAPVADVNSDPRNPVIGVRSFGSDAALVSRHVAAAVRGLQHEGVAACAKHFPGHGATATDSHHAVPTLARTRAELEAIDLPPFAAAIAAGTRGVMTGHLAVPALDDRLATASREITTRLLREQLGFAGTVVTDALEMGALAGTLGIERGFVAALRAGADAIETGAQDYPQLVETIPDAVARAIDDGVVSLDRLRDAARRTRDLAAPAGIASGPGTAAAPALDIAARCLEIRGPLPALTRPVVVEARPPANMASGELPWSLAAPLAELLPGVDAVPVAGPGRISADGRSLVVVVRDPLRHVWQRALIDAAAQHPGAVVVDVGWPSEMPDEVPLVRTRGIAPPLLNAAARVLAAPRPTPA
jgi:beta-N-acetylhexosaminidase